MNRLKKIAMNMVLVAGMALMGSSIGLAQQETAPDQFLGTGEMTPAQPMANAQQKDKDRLASSQRQSKNRKHKQAAKQNASDKPTVVIARK